MPIVRDNAMKKRSAGRTRKTTVLATKQAKKTPRAGKNGNIPPPDKQFGQPNGNPRHNGAWKKEDTLRFKLQQIAKMDSKEIEAGLNDENELSWGEYEKAVGQTVLDLRRIEEPEKRLHAISELTNQDSGMPKQAIEKTELEPPVPLSPRQAATEPAAEGVGVVNGGARESNARPTTRRPRQTVGRSSATSRAESVPLRTLGGDERKPELAQSFPRRRARRGSGTTDKGRRHSRASKAQDGANEVAVKDHKQ